MALNDDKIKDLFSSKLGGFEPELPASIWGGIDQLLSQQPVVDIPDADASSSSTSSSSTAGTTSTIKTVFIAAGVAASVALGVFVMSDREEAVVPAIVEEHQQEKTPSVATATFPIDEPEVLAHADVVTPRTYSRVAKPKTESSAEPVTFASPAVAEAEVAPEVNPKEEEVKDIEIVEELPPLVLPKFLKEDLSLSIRTSAGALSESVNNTGGDILFSQDIRSSELMSALKNENKDYELVHNQPISVGFTVSKQLTRQFSIETGLVYTHLSSRIKSNSALILKEKQTFGYLGIPVYLNYTFYELGKAKFYLSLGAMAQKDIYGRYTSKMIVNEDVVNNGTLDIPDYLLYMEPSYVKENISQSNWQFSTHLNLGAAYPIYKKLYIYGAVGGAYYFDAGNEYRTVFSDRKLQLDLNLGLKFDF